MQHWYLTAPRTAAIVEEPDPVPGPGEVLVRLAYTAISPGSNVHVWRTGSYRPEPTGEPEDLLYMGSGVVEAVGSDVTLRSVGDRVVVSSGHQELITAPEGSVYPVPAGLSLRDATMSYLPSWSVSALHLGRYRPAETVAVVGLGLVGASAALVADLNGARVLALDIDERRLALARERFGLLSVAHPDDQGGVARVLNPLGPDLVIETTGHWSGFRQAIALARDFTRIAVMGIYRTPPPPDLAAAIHGQLFTFPAKFHYKRLELIGCGADPAVVRIPAERTATPGSNWVYVLEQAARGRLALGSLITDVLPPAAIGDALDRLAGGETSMLGVVFDWGLGVE